MLYRFDQGKFLETDVYPVTYGPIFGSQGQFYYEDNDTDFLIYNDQTGITTINAVFYLITSSPGTSEGYVTAVNNEIFEFQNGQFTSTPAFALNISAF